MAIESLEGFKYTRGFVHPNTKSHATFEYKEGSTGYTGGGYPRWRSTEYREHTPGERREDVYVSVHRLCAVAWLFDDGVTAEDIISGGLMVNNDVHHELGMPSCNIEGEISLRSHGTHSEITQAQVRAWGETAKEQATGEYEGKKEMCSQCGSEADYYWVSDDLDGKWCTECTMNHAPEGSSFKEA